MKCLETRQTKQIKCVGHIKTRIYSENVYLFLNCYGYITISTTNLIKHSFLILWVR